MRSIVVIAALALGIGGSTAAQSYPDRSITLIVPFSPGGSTDLIGRILADHLSSELGKPVVVDNRDGAGGSLGTQIGAEARPDGYTLLLGASAPLVISPAFYPDLTYDPVKDFEHVSLVAGTANLLVVNKDVPANTLSEFIALAKENPGKYRFGSAGNGSNSHIAAELFNILADTKISHIPYKGTGPALTDIVAGRTHMFVNNMPALVPYVQQGTLRALAIASNTRSSMLPDVPTSAEAGLPKYEVTGWFGLLAPAGTPKEIVEKLNVAVSKINQTEVVKKRLMEVGADPMTSSPKEFSDYLDQEIQKWRSVVQQSGAKAE